MVAATEPHNICSKPSSPNEPFYCTPENAIVVIDIIVESTQDDEQYSFLLIAHRTSFAKLCHDLTTADHGMLANGATMEWESWGSRVARWLHVDAIVAEDVDWLAGRMGQRLVLVYELYDPETYEAANTFMTILDFNPHAIPRHEDSNGEYVLTHLKHPVFKNAVASSLPYTRTVSEWKGKKPSDLYERLWLDGGRLVGLQIDGYEDRITAVELIYVDAEAL
ncbi:hypothetical protein C0995_016054 [Termitomyces sp. Mi166|nr:hypothetical protein C0995_016054 [Termitomyces sp. Mi166\